MRFVKKQSYQSTGKARASLHNLTNWSRSEKGHPRIEICEAFQMHVTELDTKLTMVVRKSKSAEMAWQERGWQHSPGPLMWA